MPVKIKKNTGNKSVLSIFIHYDKCHIIIQNIFFFWQIEYIVLLNWNLLSIMNAVELFPSCKGISWKKDKKHEENKFTLFWIML